MSRKKIISSATTDLVSDQRVHRVCKTLDSMGFDVISVGREKEFSLPLKNRPYKTKRLKLHNEKGPYFYAEYNLKLFWYLMRSDADILLANDLDSLVANSMASWLKGIPLVYDSHEYFIEVPELYFRPFIRRIWAMLERIFIRRVSKAYTVSNSIADELEKRYKKKFDVIRNLPERVNIVTAKREAPRNIKSDTGEKILIYQGSVNMGRGLEELVEAMKYVEHKKLYIVGDGDVLERLKELRKEFNLVDKVVFTGRLPYEELVYYTVQADIGISLEKKIGMSYEMALPNKVFDYIQAGIPVFMSSLPELGRLNLEYEFGAINHSHDPEVIADNIERVFYKKEWYLELKANARKAAKVLNWENESQKLKLIFSDFLDQEQSSDQV